MLSRSMGPNRKQRHHSAKCVDDVGAICNSEGGEIVLGHRDGFGAILGDGRLDRNL